MEAKGSAIPAKVLLLGDAKVGKSKLLYRYTCNSFSDEYNCTVDVGLVRST